MADSSIDEKLLEEYKLLTSVGSFRGLLSHVDGVPGDIVSNRSFPLIKISFAVFNLWMVFLNLVLLFGYCSALPIPQQRRGEFYPHIQGHIFKNSTQTSQDISVEYINNLQSIYITNETANTTGLLLINLTNILIEPASNLEYPIFVEGEFPEGLKETLVSPTSFRIKRSSQKKYTPVNLKIPRAFWSPVDPSERIVESDSSNDALSIIRKFKGSTRTPPKSRKLTISSSSSIDPNPTISRNAHIPTTSKTTDSVTDADSSPGIGERIQISPKLLKINKSFLSKIRSLTKAPTRNRSTPFREVQPRAADYPYSIVQERLNRTADSYKYVENYLITGENETDNLTNEERTGSNPGIEESSRIQNVPDVSSLATGFITSLSPHNQSINLPESTLSPVISTVTEEPETTLSTLPTEETEIEIFFPLTERHLQKSASVSVPAQLPVNTSTTHSTTQTPVATTSAEFIEIHLIRQLSNLTSIYSSPVTSNLTTNHYAPLTTSQIPVTEAPLILRSTNSSTVSTAPTTSQSENSQSLGRKFDQLNFTNSTTKGLFSTTSSFIASETTDSETTVLTYIPMNESQVKKEAVSEAGSGVLAVSLVLCIGLLLLVTGSYAVWKHEKNREINQEAIRPCSAVFSR